MYYYVNDIAANGNQGEREATLSLKHGVEAKNYDEVRNMVVQIYFALVVGISHTVPIRDTQNLYSKL